MGSRARDFNGNEVYDVERMPENDSSDIENKLQELDSLISRCEDEAQAARDELSSWDNVKEEVEDVRDKLQEKLDSLCTNCYEKPSTDDFGLCVDCEENYHPRVREECTLDDRS